MISIATYRSLALSYPEVVECPHFEMTSFRVRKKIFTTLSEKDSRVMVRLSPLDQSVFCAFDRDVIYPVPGSWGKGGATYVQLKKIKKNMLRDMLTLSYCQVAPKALSGQYRTDSPD
jgi:hypothetical protein